MKTIKRMLTLAAVWLMVFAFSGCGEPLADLTEEEEATIVAYSAHVVSKYNKRQPDGVCRVFLPDEPEEPEEPAESEEPYAEELPEEESPDEAPASEPSAAQEAAPEDSTPVVDLASFLGSPSLNMNWTYTEVTQSYVNNDAISITAGNNNAYVVLTIKVTNPTETDQPLNVLEQAPGFGLKVNGQGKIPCSLTILPTDLSTFEGTIPAGSTVETQLFFQRPVSEIQADDLYALVVTLNGESGKVEQP